MNADNVATILTLLSTMKGFPAFPAPKPESELTPVQAAYAGVLIRISDEDGKAIRNGLLFRYDERPSVKALADWARELSASRLPDVPAYLLPDIRSAGIGRPGVAAVALLTTAARNAKADGGAIPAAAKEAIRLLRDQHKGATAVIVPVADAGDWGLEHKYKDGRLDRLPARYSEAAARQKAKEQAAKYPHVTVRVYCKSDSAIPVGGRETAGNAR